VKGEQVERKLIIHPDLQGDDPELGLDNVNGPSLIRVPEWVENPLGQYYLYFAHHQGEYIRLAHADNLEGPWEIYSPGRGVLHLEDTTFVKHIASPDVHVDEENRRLAMFFHGPHPEGGQRTAMATSTDGLHFAARKETLGLSYFRVFQWRGTHYASAFGSILRSEDWSRPFEAREQKLFPGDPRHTAIKLDGDLLTVFYSRRGDAPEHIMVSRVQLAPDWNEWTPSAPETVLKPELPFEGVDLPVEPSRGGRAHGPVHQLRDPAVYREGDRTWLLYSVAGESGIAITEWKG